MINPKSFFLGKKITIMGLGLLGRGVGYTKFLAECGANLTVTDLKNSEQLATSLKILAKYKNIKFVLGEHCLEDFRDCDMVIKAAGVPLDSIYIQEAKKNNISVEMDVSLFAKLAPEVKIIGITGTRGKSMTTHIIYEILKENLKGNNVFLGGNVRGVATLPLLKKVKLGDVLVAELDSWQLQGFGENKISPHIAVFTTFMSDHMNYYKGDMDAYFADKANIFKYQKHSDTLVIGEKMKSRIRKGEIKGDCIIAKSNNVKGYKFLPPGEHNRANLACAVEALKVAGIPESKIKKSVAKFKGVEGRLQLLRIWKGIKVYNDNNATTIFATMAGIRAVGNSKAKKLILICGGNDKVPDESLKPFTDLINKYCKALITIPGSGTERLRKEKSKTQLFETKDLKEAVKAALGVASRGDTVLFSPAFSSFAQFNNEYERNDLFIKLVKKLK